MIGVSMIEPLNYETAKKGSAVATVKLDQGMYVHARMDEMGFTHLVCGCEVYARKLWCPHVESVATDDHYMAKSPPEWSPSVVVFRKPYWLIVPVLVVPPSPGSETDFYRLDVLWGNPHKVGNEYEANGGQAIGYIGRNDRRKAIRSLILEWLPSLIYRTEARKCTSPLHSVGDSVIEFDAYVMGYGEVDDERRRQMLTEAYNILDTGKCVACQIASAIPF